MVRQETIRRSAPWLLAGLLVWGCASPADADSQDQLGALKAAAETEPAPKLSAEDKIRIAQKIAEVDASLSKRGQTASASTQLMTVTSVGQLQQTQVAQSTYYYCGPATITESLAQMGIGLSQASAATLLKTTTDGTAWYGINAQVPSPTGYPMRDVMNYKIGSPFYVPKSLPTSPSAQDKADYNNYLHQDIDSGHPVLGNAYE